MSGSEEGPESYSVSEAVKMSGRSEATVRRQIGSQLAKVEGAEPTRIRAASLVAWCDELRRHAPAPLPAVMEREATADQVAGLQSKIGALEYANENLSAENLRLATENEQLRHTVQSLRQAHVILTDELGTYTSPSIPDN
jgi:hypothetical protein